MTRLQREQTAQASKGISWIYFVFNLGVVPALLFFREMAGLALLVFIVNTALTVFLLTWQQNRALREHVERTSPDLENHDAVFEIDNDGITCDHAGNKTTYAWKNVKSVDQTAEAIYFDAGYAKMFIPKRVFNEPNACSNFLAEAQRLKLASIN